MRTEQVAQILSGFLAVITAFMLLAWFVTLAVAPAEAQGSIPIHETYALITRMDRAMQSDSELTVSVIARYDGHQEYNARLTFYDENFACFANFFRPDPLETCIPLSNIGSVEFNRLLDR